MAVRQYLNGKDIPSMAAIGYVVHVKTPGTSGGETRSYQMAQALGLAGVDVHLYGDVATSFAWAPGVFPHKLQQPMPRALLQLVEDFRRHHIQVVIERYQFPLVNPGMLAQLLRGRPIVLEVHGFPIEEWEAFAKKKEGRVSLLIRLAMRMPRPFWESFQQALFRRAAHFIVTSSGTRDILVSLNVPASRISVVYNCVDPQRFNPEGRDQAACRQSLGLPTQGRLVLYAGSLLHEELGTVLQALPRVIAAMPDVCAVFTGFGAVDQLTAQARAIGLTEQQFRTMNPVPHHRMPDLLAAVDVVLAPYSLQSTRFSKAFHYSPLKIMEALAMEKPVVTVAAQELQAVFSDVANVRYAASGAVDSWARELQCAIEMVGDTSLRQGRAFVMHGHTWGDAAQKYLAIVREVGESQR